MSPFPAPATPDPVNISRQALNLLSTADIVAKEAWSSQMPALLRNAAYDLLAMLASDSMGKVAS